MNPENAANNKAAFFIEAFNNVFLQLGFSETKQGDINITGGKCVGSGLIGIVGIVGEMRGNVVYIFSLDNAKKIASKMMMGMPVEEIDDMVRSALSELTNMITANATICASKEGVSIDISTPTLMQGDGMSLSLSAKQVFNIHMFADDVHVEMNVAIEK